PGIYARLLVTPQHAVDLLGDLLRVGRRGAEQLAEDLPHLGRRQGRCFFSPADGAPASGTTGPAAPGSCDGANQPSPVPRTAPGRPRLCLPAAPPRSG